MNPYAHKMKTESPVPASQLSLIARRILDELMHFRRSAKTQTACANADCPQCSQHHLPKILWAVSQWQPVQLVLPAFPGKSPNLEKVLGVLPDLAEQLSLNFLHQLGERIKDFYPPGIHIKICSDGRVFSDIVGIAESNISAYQHELQEMMGRMGLRNLSIFNLDEVYPNQDYVQMRQHLLRQYGPSLVDIQDEISRGGKATASPDALAANQLYRGMVRFLFEDQLYKNQIQSRTAIQKAARSRAYTLIQRSNAWSALIAEWFPMAVRLSIHPQPCGSHKLGIRLIGNESWMTPWHGVAVKGPEGYLLLKRKEAEALGARLVQSADGRHSHYQLNQEEVCHVV